MGVAWRRARGTAHDPWSRVRPRQRVGWCSATGDRTSRNGMTELLRVVIADDEPDARAKLERLLAEDDATTVIGQAATGTAAVEAVRALRPNVLFLDVRMPELDGFQVLEHLSGDEDGPKI